MGYHASKHLRGNFNPRSNRGIPLLDSEVFRIGKVVLNGISFFQSRIDPLATYSLRLSPRYVYYVPS